MSAAERVMVAYLTIVALLWCLVVLAVGWGLLGPGTGAPWATRVVAGGIVASVTICFVLVARSRWRSAARRPFSGRGLSGWMERQPGWRLAVMAWAAYAAMQVGVAYAASRVMHRLPSLWWELALLVWWAVLATGQAAMWRVMWDRQKRLVTSTPP
jgi:hypothetical protein